MNFTFLLMNEGKTKKKDWHGWWFLLWRPGGLDGFVFGMI